MNKFAIIVPYRERENHLAVFSQYYKSMFTDVDIFVIEQVVGKPFNRGKLLNVGFQNFGKNYDYCAYHDVDMLGIPGKVDYSFPESPTHLASHASQFGYGMPYPTYFGGVTLINKEDMIKINGYPNEMWGWGCEDDMLHKTIVFNGLKAARREGWFECLPHVRNANHALYEVNFKRLNAIRESTDGLSHCESWTKGIDKNILYTKVTVTM